MNHRATVALRILVSGLILSATITGEAEGPYEPSETTKIAFLGTGTPIADPERSGPSVAVIVRGVPYIVDFGPGLIRRAAALSTDHGGPLEGFEIATIKRAFLTHLHSDHTTGYPDLIFTPWVLGRDEPLEVYGPEGIEAMTKHILEAYSEDIRLRVYGREPANNRGWRVNVNAIEVGTIYRDDNVTVEAFAVEHGSWPESYGFKFTTPDRVIAISGDTRPSETLVEACRGVDILVHEVYSQAGFEKREKNWQEYHSRFHTSAPELAGIASQVKPGLLILYHQLYWGSTDEELLAEIKAGYDGNVVSAKDLDVY
jgi:ribonuclease BN (tRNA processing enzyme)